MNRDYFNALCLSSKYGVGPTCLNIIVAYKTVKTNLLRKTNFHIVHVGISFNAASMWLDVNMNCLCLLIFLQM